MADGLAVQNCKVRDMKSCARAVRAQRQALSRQLLLFKGIPGTLQSSLKASFQ